MVDSVPSEPRDPVEGQGEQPAAPVGRPAAAEEPDARAVLEAAAGRTADGTGGQEPAAGAEYAADPVAEAVAAYAAGGRTPEALDAAIAGLSGPEQRRARRAAARLPAENTTAAGGGTEDDSATGSTEPGRQDPEPAPPPPVRSPRPYPPSPTRRPAPAEAAQQGSPDDDPAAARAASGGGDPDLTAAGLPRRIPQPVPRPVGTSSGEPVDPDADVDTAPAATSDDDRSPVPPPTAVVTPSWRTPAPLAQMTYPDDDAQRGAAAWAEDPSPVGPDDPDADSPRLPVAAPPAPLRPTPPRTPAAPEPGVDPASVQAAEDEAALAEAEARAADARARAAGADARARAAQRYGQGFPSRVTPAGWRAGRELAAAAGADTRAAAVRGQAQVDAERAASEATVRIATDTASAQQDEAAAQRAHERALADQEREVSSQEAGVAATRRRADAQEQTNVESAREDAARLADRERRARVQEEEHRLDDADRVENAGRGRRRLYPTRIDQAARRARREDAAAQVGDAAIAAEAEAAVRRAEVERDAARRQLDAIDARDEAAVAALELTDPVAAQRAFDRLSYIRSLSTPEDQRLFRAAENGSEEAAETLLNRLDREREARGEDPRTDDEREAFIERHFNTTRAEVTAEGGQIDRFLDHLTSRQRELFRAAIGNPAGYTELVNSLSFEDRRILNEEIPRAIDQARADMTDAQADALDAVLNNPTRTGLAALNTAFDGHAPNWLTRFISLGVPLVETTDRVGLNAQNRALDDAERARRAAEVAARPTVDPSDLI